MKEETLLEKIDPYHQALKAMEGVEHFGVTSSEASQLLNDLSGAFTKGIADAVMRLHKHYYRKNKMPMHLFKVMEEIYGESGWFI